MLLTNTKTHLLGKCSFKLPNCNLFTRHVIALWRDTSSEPWIPIHSFRFYYHLLQALFTFRKHYFTLPRTNIYFQTICLILCYQQTSEIDNLTASWGKVVWLCCVQVPRCYWRWSHTSDCFLVPLPKSASNNVWKWFLFPTGRLKLGFITEGKLTVVLIIPSSWGFPTSPVRHQDFFWRRYRGERGFLQGESLTSNLFTLLLFCLVSLLHFCLHLFSKNTKKLVSFIAVIFVCLL
jgi:hypothetical protein